MKKTKKHDWNKMPTMSMEISKKWVPIIKFDPDIVNMFAVMDFISKNKNLFEEQYKLSKENKNAKR